LKLSYTCLELNLQGFENLAGTAYNLQGFQNLVGIIQSPPIKKDQMPNYNTVSQNILSCAFKCLELK